MCVCEYISPCASVYACLHNHICSVCLSVHICEGLRINSFIYSSFDVCIPSLFACPELPHKTSVGKDVEKGTMSIKRGFLTQKTNHFVLQSPEDNN